MNVKGLLFVMALASGFCFEKVGLASSQREDMILSEGEAAEIGLEAFHYFYPLITMDLTRRVMTHFKAGEKPGMGPANEFHHLRSFPSAEFREVVRPNFDTLYSNAWVDLRQGPVIISAPETFGRYYLLPMLDMWSDVFAVPGKRTSGTKPMQVALVPQGWKGQLPPGVLPIHAPTPIVWIIGRTQTNGPGDYSAVHKIQDGFKIIPLSNSGKPYTPPSSPEDKSVDFKTPPLVQVNKMEASEYFEYAAKLLQIHPPHGSDWSQLARIRRLGIEVGKDFDFSQSPQIVKNALQYATREGLRIMQEKTSSLARNANGWQMNTDTMGVYGNFYLKRAAVAMLGLGANQPEDAVYPMLLTDSQGQALQGGKNYILKFKKEELPPVHGFWSVTMYDGEGFPIPNSINRFAIGDRDPLKYQPDGSLELYIQPQSPGPEKASQWLPSALSGALGITMRLYAPKAQVLDGRWVPPSVELVSPQG